MLWSMAGWGSPALKAHRPNVRAMAPMRTWQSLMSEAAILEAEGRWEEAAFMYMETAKSAAEKEGRDSKAVCSALEGLERVFRRQNLAQKADDVRKELVEIKFLSSSKNKREYADQLIKRENYFEAEKLLQEALDACCASIGEERSETAAVMDNLATVKRLLGRVQEAVPLCERAMEIRRLRLPVGHPHIAVSCSNLGFLYRVVGRLSDSERLLLESICIREAHPSIGADHPETAESYDRYSGLLKDLKRLAEAKQFCERALGIRSRRFGDDHPLTAASKNNLAEIKKLIAFHHNLADAGPPQGESKASSSLERLLDAMKDGMSKVLQDPDEHVASGEAGRQSQQGPGTSGSELTPGAARELIKYEVLRLSHVTSMTAETAEVLAAQKGVLDLRGLRQLPSSVARALSRHEGELLLNGLEEISVNAAANIRTHRGPRLVLDGLLRAIPDVLMHLAHHRGDLSMAQLRAIDDESAEMINKHRGLVCLTGLRIASKRSVSLLRSNPRVQLSDELGNGV